MRPRGIAGQNYSLRSRRRNVGLSSISLDDQLIAMITGEGAYYRVSDLDTLFVERTGALATTPASVDGPVGTIKDKGPNARHLTASADIARGTLRFSGGIYYIEGDGTNTRYISAVMASSPTWLHYLAQTARRRNTVELGFQRRESSSIYARIGLMPTNNLGRLVSRNGASNDVASSAISSVPINTWATVDGFAEVAANHVGVNGGAYVNAVSVNTNVAMAGSINIFISPGGGVDLVQGDWAGGFYLNRVPATDERELINAAMMSLYDPSILEELGLILE